MKIVSWNINGIRTFKGGIKNALESLDADIVCVQETKVTSKNFTRESLQYILSDELAGMLGQTDWHSG